MSMWVVVTNEDGTMNANAYGPFRSLLKAEALADSIIKTTDELDPRDMENDFRGPTRWAQVVRLEHFDMDAYVQRIKYGVER